MLISMNTISTLSSFLMIGMLITLTHSVDFDGSL